MITSTRTTTVTAHNIDTCIEAAIDAGIQVMLMNYKNRPLGYDDPKKRFKL